jgi:hypothetical protein
MATSIDYQSSLATRVAVRVARPNPAVHSEIIRGAAYASAIENS